MVAGWYCRPSAPSPEGSTCMTRLFAPCSAGASGSCWPARTACTCSRRHGWCGGCCRRGFDPPAPGILLAVLGVILLQLLFERLSAILALVGLDYQFEADILDVVDRLGLYCTLVG